MTPPADDAGRVGLAAAARDRRKPRMEIDGVEFDDFTEDGLAGYVMDELDAHRGGLIVTTNVDILRLLREPQNAHVAEIAEVVVADGQPVVWASRLAGKPVPMRVAGSSLVKTLARDAVPHHRSIFILGGPPRAAELAASRLTRMYPGLTIAGTACPRWGFQDDPRRWNDLRQQLLRAEPDIVYLALGAPKQENIALRLREDLPATWFLGCGGSVSFLAGLIPQAPLWMQRSGLEWVHRLVHEPRRLWRRYLVDDVPYALALLARSARAGRRRR